MVSLSGNIATFFSLCGVQLLAALAGEAMGVFIGTSTMDYEKAMTIATVTSLALMLTGGYFVKNLPEFMGWLRYVSPFKYSYDACIKLGFDRDVPCVNGETLEECLSGAGMNAVCFFLCTYHLCLFFLVLRIVFKHMFFSQTK
jgi:ABC-type multidrug transport system permease subunit